MEGDKEFRFSVRFKGTVEGADEQDAATNVMRSIAHLSWCKNLHHIELFTHGEINPIEVSMGKSKSEGEAPAEKAQEDAAF